LERSLSLSLFIAFRARMLNRCSYSPEEGKKGKEKNRGGNFMSSLDSSRAGDPLRARSKSQMSQETGRLKLFLPMDRIVEIFQV
jgi:hypothetical protein